MNYGWIWVGAVVVLMMPGVAWGQEEWTIEQFDAVITVQADGAVHIEERISVDFGDIEKHGIFRDVPIVYQRESGGEVYTKVSEVAVEQDGSPAKLDITRERANMRLRIGDPDQTISGRHTYMISYRVLGVLQAFEGFDELNWNVTGHEWEVPIKRVSVTVRIPANIQQVACYAGARGSTTACTEATQADGVAQFAAGPLAVGEGVTVAAGYAPNVIPVVSVSAPPSPWDIIFSPVTAMVGIGTLVLGVLWIARHWWRYGRDRYWQRAHLPGERSDREGTNLPEKTLPLFFQQSVSVEYESPDGLRPAEAGVLMDERADTLDVSATIVDLAARGYLTITEIPKQWVFGKKDYEFTNLEKPDDDLLIYERELRQRLFDGNQTVKLSALKNSFYKDLAKVKELLYQEVVRKKLFAAPPNRVKQTAAAKSIGMSILGGLLLGAAAWWLNIANAVQIGQQVVAGLGIGAIGVGIISLGLSPQMPRKTGYGRELYERMRGYELFVGGTEKHRAKFYENEGLFMEVLPYAIMFGVTDTLARAFREMGIEPPEPTWFRGATTFNAAHFAASMHSFSHSLSSAMAASPSGSSSSGGGFSGGGFGGGGGGSW